MKPSRSLPCFIAGALFSALSAHATPYASGLTNNGNGTMSFYLNEAGGNATITYEDHSVNPNYNGSTTGTNLPIGLETFSVTGHTSYTISVFKVGAGAPTLINSSPGFTPRGVAVNSRPASPYFGTVYADISGGNINVFHGDFSPVNAASRSGGVTWAGGGLSPYRLSIAADDYLMVGDASSANAGVFRIDPTVSTNQVFLGPVGEGTAGVGNGDFGTIQSEPLIVGDPSTGPVTLMDVDGDFQGVNGYNSLLIYSNISLASLPYEAAPSVQGPEIGVGADSEVLGDNEYPGLRQGTNGYIYASTFRNNLSNPLLQIYDSTGTNQIWNSYYNGGTADYFLTTSVGHTQGIIDIAVSGDQQYVAGVTIDNWLVICPLTNGIPNTQALYLSTPTSYSGNGRGLAFDAADNLYISSSGLGLLQSWSLGLTATAVTAGNTNGSTGFEFVPLSAAASVIATTSIAYQASNSYQIVNFAHSGVVPAVFTLSLAAPEDGPIPVVFTLTGTATNGVNYNASTNGQNLPVGPTYTVVFPAGVTNELVTITPTTNPVSGPTLTVILNIQGSAFYSAVSPTAGTASIANSGLQELSIDGTGASSMYRGLSNDFVTFVVTRFGDTNAGAWTLPFSAFVPGGTAQYLTDYKGGPQAVNFTTAGTSGYGSGGISVNPGDQTEMVEVGLPLAHATYTGAETILLSGTSGSSVEGTNYTFVAGAATATLLDNLNPTENVIWSDALTSTADESDWNVTYSENGTNVLYFFPDYNGVPTQDYDANFGYPAADDFLARPPSGAANVLRVTCEKNPNDPVVSGGVNLYPNNAPVFSGNYALRFSMNLARGVCADALATESMLFGINHFGTNVNWWLGDLVAGGFSLTNTDGVWYSISADAEESSVSIYSGDFTEMTSLNGTTIGAFPSTGYEALDGLSSVSYTNIFKNPVDYNATTAQITSGIDAGLPANDSDWTPDAYSGSGCSGNPTGPWTDVEVKQFDNVITMSLNKTIMFTYTNTTPINKGTIMFGYMVPYGEYGQGSGGGAYFSNVRVVSLTAPVIKSVVLSGGNVVITFTSPDADAVPSSFTLLSGGTVNGVYAAATATITQSGEVFTAVTPYSSSGSHFFVIGQNAGQ